MSTPNTQPARRGTVSPRPAPVADPKAAPADRNRSRRPNVILFVTDDQGYGDLGCHGNPYINTPHMDALFAESVRLNNFHVDPTCSPTRSALMTGRYSHRVNVWHTIMGRNYLRQDVPTMAEIFRAAGYRTAHFGKWHLGGHYPYRPIDRGFETWLGQGDGGTGCTSDHWGNDRVDDVYLKNGEEVQIDGYGPDVFFDAAIDYITERSESGGPSRDAAGTDAEPFFMYLATYIPHNPNSLPDRSWADRYRDSVPMETAYFYSSIERADWNLGRLRRTLTDLGIAENTLLVFMTDNGTASGHEAFNAGMRGHKGSVYDGGHRVPCFISWPAGDLAAGTSVESTTAHVDLLPTFVDLCGLSTGSSKAGAKTEDGGHQEKDSAGELRGMSAGRLPEPRMSDTGGNGKVNRKQDHDSSGNGSRRGANAELHEAELDGKSLAPLLRSSPEGLTTGRRPRTIVVESQRIQYPEKYRDYAVLHGEWRLVNGTELYSIDNDPGQVRDVSAEYPGVVARLAEAYEGYWSHVTEGDEEYARPVIGALTPEESTVVLSTEHLLCDEGSESAWNQLHVTTGVKTTGFWPIYVARSGKYQLEFRRWPREIAAPMDGVTDYARAKSHEAFLWDEKITTTLYGAVKNVKPAALPVAAVAFTVDETRHTISVEPGADSCATAVALSEGEHTLRAEMLSAAGELIGAPYYVYISSGTLGS